MKPTYDELVDLIAQLRAEIEELKRENAQLKERLGLNSNNSSKPPSTDQRRNKQKPKGGAIKGHKGHFRKLSDYADKHITSKLAHCRYCGSKNLKKRSSQFFDQVDLPEINPVVTRVECPKYRCEECGKKQVASFPEGYDKTSFGLKLINFISLCSSAYRISKRTTQGLLKNLLNVYIALGSIPSMERKMSRAFNTVLSRGSSRDSALGRRSVFIKYSYPVESRIPGL